MWSSSNKHKIVVVGKLQWCKRNKTWTFFLKVADVKICIKAFEWETHTRGDYSHLDTSTFLNFQQLHLQALIVTPTPTPRRS